MKRALWTLTLAALLLSGCSLMKLPVQSPSGIVTGITVLYENEPVRLLRRYTNSEKMRQVLNYLRLVDPKGSPEIDPESMPGGMYTITLLYSDGNNRIYRQKSDAYMQIDEGPWELINPKKAEWLSQLVGQMESDYD